MKGKLSFRHAAGLSLHLLMDNFFRAVITVVLLGVCCAAFGVCICAYGHNYMGTQAEIFRAYEANTVALSRFCFFRGLNVSATDCMGLQTQDVAQLEETFGGRAALIFHEPYPSLTEEYRGPADYDYGVFQEKWFYGDYDRKAAAIRSTEAAAFDELPTYDEEYFANYPEGEAAHYLTRDNNLLAEAYCYLPEESLEEFGCTLLAGEMPQDVDEIAINACWLAEFVLHDYYLYEDVAAGEPVYYRIQTPIGSQLSLDVGRSRSAVLNIDEIPSIDPGKVQPIDRAEDMIGKQLALLGGAENDPGYRLVTVTGVVDTGCSDRYYHEYTLSETGDRSYFELHDKIFVGEGWVEEYAPAGCSAALFPRPTDEEAILRYVEFIQPVLDAADRMNVFAPSLSSEGAAAEGDADEELDDPILIAGENDLLRQTVMRGEMDLYTLIFGGGGAVLTVLGVLLCVNLISSSIERNRYDFGVLKALGARNADIYKICLLQCVLLGLCIAALGLGGLAGIIYGWMGHWAMAGSVRIIKIGALQIAAALLFGVGVPAAAGALTVRSVLRGSPVDITLSRKERKEKKSKKGGM